MKAIFNKDNGIILAFTTSDQDYTRVMANWPNSDAIDINFIPSKFECGQWQVNTSTRTLEKIT